MGLIYVFSYSPFLYYTAYSDSQYLVENEEENIAPTGFVHNDFIEQRKPRVVEVDDFDRRGYLEQAIEDFADKDEIIDLLAENPSITWIDIRNIKFGRRIGCGGSAEVREGIWNGGSVAVKTLFHNEHSTLRVFFREVKVMSLLHSPNILLFMGICVDSENRYIITELMRRGCVFNIIHSEKHHSDLTGERIKRILIHSARGILYLHSHNPPILHRDLKSHNLLVDDNWTVKVADFGLSRAKAQKLMTSTGTPQWAAPEVIRKEFYSEKADVYSFGIIIFELLTGQIPFDNMSQIDVLNSVGNYNTVPKFPEETRQKCPQYVALAMNCWQKDPELRYSFKDILEKLKSFPPPDIPCTPYVPTIEEDCN